MIFLGEITKKGTTDKIFAMKKSHIFFFIVHVIFYEDFASL